MALLECTLISSCLWGYQYQTAVNEKARNSKPTHMAQTPPIWRIKEGITAHAEQKHDKTFTKIRNFLNNERGTPLIKWTTVPAYALHHIRVWVDYPTFPQQLRILGELDGEWKATYPTVIINTDVNYYSVLIRQNRSHSHTEGVAEAWKCNVARKPSECPRVFRQCSQVSMLHALLQVPLRHYHGSTTQGRTQIFFSGGKLLEWGHFLHEFETLTIFPLKLRMNSLEIFKIGIWAHTALYLGPPLPQLHHFIVLERSNPIQPPRGNSPPFPAISKP